MRAPACLPKNGRSRKPAEEYAADARFVAAKIELVVAPQGRVAFDLFQTNDVFERLTKMRPDATGLWIARGRWHLFSNRWHEALSDYAHIIKFLPIGDEWTDYAALLLITGDESDLPRVHEIDAPERRSVHLKPREAYFCIQNE